jgi:predicted CXXCH cytochrome family protein
MKKYILLLVAVIAAVISVLPTGAVANMGIANTKHNLSVSGPGELKALTETRICIFCHTPHNAAPRTPLWNREIQEGIIYVPYTSTTMGATVSQPTGPSRLCLSCHDGTLALGAVLRPAAGIEMTGEITPDRPSYIGTNLTNHHPVSFSYYDSLPNPELEPFLPEGLLFYGAGYIHCSTCHNSHDDTYGKFLVMDNSYSRLCMECHKKTGWELSTHKTSGIALPSPLPGKDWTGWSTVAEYGCESCHVPHTAGGAKRILIYSKEEENCYHCHDGTVALKNIQFQFQSKLSTHPVEATTGLHEPNETQLSPFVTGHVECVDCHNPHIANNKPGAPPLVSGKLDGVSGVTLSGVGVSSATYEYEICFKCHSDTNSSVFLPVLRVINETNARYQFNTLNPSFHPVTGIGPNQNVPSLSPPSPDPEAPQALSASSRIYCSDCHSDDSGSIGPHGSEFAPILKRRYEILDGTFESYENYNLCYRCHNRTSILNDESFKKHNKHIVELRTPCSVCHDPHGITDNGLSGSHTHLINFDTRVVSAISGKQFPEFNDTGTFSGSCTLLCHGKDHNDERYPN